MRGRISSASAQIFRPIVRAYVSLGKAREAWEVTLALSERFQRPRENGEPGCCARRFSGRIAGLSRQVPAAQPVGAAAEHCTVKEDARGQRMKIKNGVEDTVR
jgi:hypothetical protein